MSAQRDWAQDYDLFDPEYAADPYPIWAELRTACPVAHTDRYGGSWLTTTYDDVTWAPGQVRGPRHVAVVFP